MSDNDDEKVSLVVFFLIWAELQGWIVPAIHIAMCNFLQHRGRLAVLQVFRGVGKSTIIAIYNAWRYYIDPTYRILHQGDQDKTAFKTSRDTKNVIMRHPLTRHMTGGIKGDITFWWVPGHNDPRNPSMQASGILSNITSSRADEIQNDDVEVQKNVETPESREKLRHRLNEQIHIGVPGSKTIFIGTPHTHNSLYDEQIEMGADSLKIPRFGKEQRFEETQVSVRYTCSFAPDIVFTGIGKHTKVLEDGVDFNYDGTTLVFTNPPNAVIDCYAQSAWPERFDNEEMFQRRKRCKTLNYWDSQYQLHAKPVTDLRLDPDKLIAYDVEPMVVYANRTAVMYLNTVKIVGMSCKWDPASGKIGNDESALSIVLQDDLGRRYWHRAISLSGPYAVYDEDGKTIIGGQIKQVCDAIKEFSIPRVNIETNGVGFFAPTALKAACKQFGIICGITEHHETKNKNKRILEAIEPPLTSGMLWIHVKALEHVEPQMLSWNPKVKEQPDDHLDAGAGAIILTPERIKPGKSNGITAHDKNHNWRPNSGVYEVSTDY